MSATSNEPIVNKNKGNIISLKNYIFTESAHMLPHFLHILM